LKALNDSDSSVRESAVVGLGKAGTDEAILGLLRALKDPKIAVREAAASALGDLKAQQAVPELIMIIENPESLIQKTAIGSLEKIGTLDAVSGLVRASESSDACVRRAALNALERINKSSPLLANVTEKAEIREEEPAMIGCLKGCNSETRIETSKLSGNIHKTSSLKELELSISVEGSEESRAHQNAVPGKRKGTRLTCPYCSGNLNLPIAPNFCPFCGMKLKFKC